MLNLICKFNITEYLVDFNMFFKKGRVNLL